jgi:hypothetical protein
MNENKKDKLTPELHNIIVIISFSLRQHESRAKMPHLVQRRLLFSAVRLTGKYFVHHTINSTINRI